MADYHVAYNGISLQEAVPGAQVINVTVQPAPIAISKTDRLVKAGSFFTRKRHGSRSVTVEIELPLKSGVGEFAHNLRLLKNWADNDAELPLELEDYPWKHLVCTLTSFPTVSIKDWYKPVSLVFTALDDPFFADIFIKEAAVGQRFEIIGDKECAPVVTHEVTEALTNPQWTADDGRKIILDGEFSSGTIVIDYAKGHVSLNGMSIMNRLDLASRFSTFRRGSHTITGPDGGVITWRERWND